MNLTLNKKYALIHYEVATMEVYNPEIRAESDDFDELQDRMDDCCCSASAVEDYTIVEKREDGIYDYYTGDLFEMKSYR